MQAASKQVPGAKVTIIRGGRLIDGKGGPVTVNPVIVIEGKRIKAIGQQGRISEPDGANIVDASGYTLMPGMIDAHLHLAAFN